MQNSDFRTRLTSVYGSQTSSEVLSTHYSVLITRTKRLYWFQTSPVVLCMQNSVPSSRNTSLYGSQTLSVDLCMQNSNFWTNLQVCMGPRPHLRFWALITACLAQEQKGYIVSRLHLWFCACKIAPLRLELHVSVGSTPHLWILHAKQRLLKKNNKSLCFPHTTCHFVHVQERA